MSRRFLSLLVPCVCGFVLLKITLRLSRLWLLRERKREMQKSNSELRWSTLLLLNPLSKSSQKNSRSSRILLILLQPNNKSSETVLKNYNKRLSEVRNLFLVSQARKILGKLRYLSLSHHSRTLQVIVYFQPLSCLIAVLSHLSIEIFCLSALRIRLWMRQFLTLVILTSLNSLLVQHLLAGGRLMDYLLTNSQLKMVYL
mmetsp:Transcript_75525/g.104476  ORF Transcript_75525/g.104476 Transcript_75525/m.104476 type:complete len:200 (+) Transcript_75525:3713-4312(+)